MAELHCNFLADSRPCRTEHKRRPSLYASVKLARFVYHVKERLKCQAQQYLLRRKDVIELPRLSLQAQARQDLNRSCSEVAHPDQTSEHVVASTQPQLQLQLEVPSLLEKLDAQTADVEPTTSSIATCDHLFLAYNARAVTRFKGIDELRHMYDLTTLLLARFSSLSGRRTKPGLLAKHPDSTLPGLDQEKFIANLEHILRCLRQASLEALIHHGMETLEEDIRQWHEHWLHDRQLDHGWFSEWPNGRRPLSTTWPWNIRPSLVVLWGVCWMFYDNNTRSVEQLRQQLEDREGASSSWSLPTPQTAAATTTNQQNITTWITGSYVPSFQASAWFPTEGGAIANNARRANRTPVYSTALPGYQPTLLTTTQNPYIAYYPAVSSDPVPDDPVVWPQDQGSHSFPVPPQDSGSNPTYSPAYRHSAPSSVPTFSPNQYNWEDPLLYEHQHSQQQPQQLLPATRRIGSGGPLQPYAPYLQQATSQRGGSATATFSPNLRPPMGPMQNYPSPHSDISKDETRSSAFSVLPSNDLSPNIMFAASPSIASHPSHVSQGRGSEEPPRNSSGQITCVHPKCARELPVFARKCEWTKHMDKHTRPYVCNLPGCEKVRGFTYSGGLSRHQREVHGQNGGPKALYMCPHTDCKRSTGSGFSRKENLQEHLRRVHRHTEDVEADPNPPQNKTAQVSGEPRRRRRRIAEEDEDEAEPILPEPRKRKRVDEEDDDNTEENLNPKEDLAAQVKRLRRELQEKDERLRKLEETVELLMKQDVQKV
ncbi:MAG: hypothetical protein Q9213_008160 [Squamulea squamosa]